MKHFASRQLRHHYSCRMFSSLRRRPSGALVVSAPPLQQPQHYQQPQHHQQHRHYHISTPAADPATIRLYRILLRQCQELTPSGTIREQQEPILLQPPLNPQAAGLSRVFQSSLAAGTSSSSSAAAAAVSVTPRHVLRLFGQWREQELERRGGGFSSSSSSTSNNNDINPDNADDDDEEDKLLAWLSPLIEEQVRSDAWMDTETLWASPMVIRQAIQLAFRHDPTTTASATSSSSSLSQSSTTKVPLIRPSDTRFWAIRAYQYLAAQTEMQRLVRLRQEATGVRITTLARCVGRSASTQRASSSAAAAAAAGALQFKYRFVYRIRIENTSTDRVFQLLGRSWIIQEHAGSGGDSSGKEEGYVDWDTGRSNSIKVHAPQTGAVGKHPVLAPGQVFEYMSGCDLATPTGLMKGAFHFAWVPAGTPPASVGQAIRALDEAFADQRFEVPVTPFPLEPDQLPVQFDP